MARPTRPATRPKNRGRNRPKPEPRSVSRDVPFRESKKTGGVERINGYGTEGAGKSKIWLDVLEGLDVPVFVVDCDESAEASLEDVDAELAEKATVFLADTWEEFRSAVNEATRRVNVYLEENEPASREEYPWIVVEMSDYTWDWVSDWYTRMVFQESIEDYFIEKRMEFADAKKNGQINEFSGWEDWKYINKEFNSVWVPLTRLSRVHLYVVSGKSGLYGDTQEKSNYRPFGGMPAGQKKLRHKFQTILHFDTDVERKKITSKKTGKKVTRRREYFSAGTGKERRRGRIKLLDHDITNKNFSVWYLQEVCGWNS